MLPLSVCAGGGAKKELVGAESPWRTPTWAILPGDEEKESHSMSLSYRFTSIQYQPEIPADDGLKSMRALPCLGERKADTCGYMGLSGSNLQNVQ